MASLQQRMCHREFAQWVAYVELYGPVDQQRRYDEPAARVAAVLAQVNGNKGVTTMDFIPYGPQAKPTGNGVLILDPEVHEQLKG